MKIPNSNILLNYVEIFLNYQSSFVLKCFQNLCLFRTFLTFLEFLSVKKKIKFNLINIHLKFKIEKIPFNCIVFY